MFQRIAHKHRNDGGWCFIGAKAVIIGSGSDTGAQQIGVVVNGFDGIDEESQEL